MMIRLRNGAIRFNRYELSGAFGDLGTDFPLIVSMVLAAGLDGASVLVMFGAMQLFTALAYGLPMPVQPLKAMAVIVITQKLGANVLYGGGLAIGLLMLLLTLTGLVEYVARLVPKAVVRGIQFGLGLQLVMLALKQYVVAEGVGGYWLAALGFVLVFLLLGHRRFPPAIPVILLGVVYAFIFKLDGVVVVRSLGLGLPTLRAPGLQDVLTGLVLLALPQLPLSLGNSVLATRQVVEDFFPGRPVSVRRIGLTYSLMNLVNPFFGGIPTCHGSGGLAGHYAFGARTGGSVVIYGLLYLVLGLFFSRGFEQVSQVFPLPVLGVLLLFEGLTLMMLVRDLFDARVDLLVALLVGVAVNGLPYGYLVGMVGGTLMFYLAERQLAGLRIMPAHVAVDGLTGNRGE